MPAYGRSGYGPTIYQDANLSRNDSKAPRSTLPHICPLLRQADMFEDAVAELVGDFVDGIRQVVEGWD